jgi:tetratricopeptide (TPR) repeat protein
MNKALKALNAETETNPIYVMLSKKFTKNITRSPELIAKTEEEVVRIKDMLKEVDSHTLRLNYYRILLYLNQTKNDHQETIKICEDVDKYYRENPHLAVDSVLSSFALTKQKSYLLLRDYENANNYTHLIESFFASGRQSWFTFQKNCFLIALNSEDYAKADAIFKQVVTNPSFKRSGDDNKDRWMLFGCYLTFLNKAGQYTSTIMDLKFFKKYNIQRLLRKIPKYSKEHLGHNLSMLTVQFLMLLFEGHRDRMTQRKEALSFYLEKFQTNRKHLRSNLMIRMIYIMIQNKFELEKTHNQTARYYKTLLPSSKNPGIMDNNEVVFYDKLWEIALLKVEEQQRERIMKKMNLKPDTNE